MNTISHSNYKSSMDYSIPKKSPKTTPRPTSKPKVNGSDHERKTEQVAKKQIKSNKKAVPVPNPYKYPPVKKGTHLYSIIGVRIDVYA